MVSQSVIDIKNVSMCFNMSEEKVDNLKEYALKLLTRRLRFQELWALNNITFDVKRGEVLGVIGLNGAGKSTLLKIIAGVLKPTKGIVTINGSMAPLIELGAGFDMELTARENIFLNGAILGHSMKFMQDKFSEIVKFSELHNFLDMPLKNYSSGMVARIGFSIATIVEPDILLVDEILSVGDFQFQQKCENKIRKMIENGTTVIFVSHSIEQIEGLCNKVLWIDHGKIKMIGETGIVCEKFRNS